MVDLKAINEMAYRRMQICHQCPSWDGKLNRCRACGCFLAAKARYPRSRCPKGFWDREDLSKPAAQ